MIHKNKPLAIVLLLTLTAYLSHSKPSDELCLGYDKTVASYAVNFASCSCLLDQFSQEIQKWTYPPCLRAQDQRSFIVDTTVITNQTQYALAYITYDRQRQWIVVSFRATTCGGNKKNFQVDAEIKQVPYNNADINGACTDSADCKIHPGFNNYYLSVRDRVRESTLKLIKKYKLDRPKLLVTGISLGAAIAAIASYDLSVYLKYNRVNIEILPYTFGQPRIGNRQFIDHIDDQIRIVRLVNQADPVPHLPPRRADFTFIFDTLAPKMLLTGNISSLLNYMYIEDYYNPGIQVFYLSPNEIPYICNGDGSFCSLNKYNDLVACFHLAYPQINFLTTSGCRIKSSEPNYDIRPTQIPVESNSSVYFLLRFLKASCGNDFYTTFPCFTSTPNEMKCQGAAGSDVESLIRGSLSGILPTFKWSIFGWLEKEYQALKDEAKAASLSVACYVLQKYLPENLTFPTIPLPIEQKQSHQL